MSVMDYFRQKKPEEVFTPRAAEVNNLMYINRPVLEAELLTAIRTNYHVVVYGDSGCGKSWLYKHTFKDNNIFYDVIDFSGAKTADDVDLIILECLSGYEEYYETDKEEERKTSFNPQNMGAERVERTKFSKAPVSATALLMEAIRNAAKRKRAVLVLENIEHILDNEEVLNQVQRMVLDLDNKDLSKFKVTLCIVGVPAEVRELLTAGNKYQTIANRVVEIPEVNRLSIEGVKLFARRGFEQELDFTVESADFCYSQIAYMSDRVPQFVHDICLHSALIGEDVLTISPDIIEAASSKWLATNARQNHEFICDCLEGSGQMTTPTARVMYAISKCEKRYFTSEDIDKVQTDIFNKKLDGKKPRSKRILTKLSIGEKRLLKCNENGHVFNLVSPKLRPVLRSCLKLSKDGCVVLHWP